MAAQDLWISLLARGEYSDDAYLKMLDLDDDMRRNAFRGFRYVLLDEAQDLNPVQRAIVQKTGLPLVAVGDPYQQIYSWRGAQNALDLLPGQSLYLTQSFRFVEKIAEVARKILAERPDGGPEKRLVGTERPGGIRNWQGPVGAWICRTNMGVLETGLKSVERNKHPIFIDNFGEIVNDVKVARALYSGVKPKEQSTKLSSFTNFAEIELEAEAGDGELARLVKIIKDDKDPDVFKLAELCVKNEADAAITIITGHRAKGREWPTVGLGADWKTMDEMHLAHAKAKKNSAAAETQAIEQFNVLYVALTRAMQTLKDPMPRLYPPDSPNDPIVEEYHKTQGAIDAAREASRMPAPAL
jgi:superfamily I DNA/RNA helicase